MQGRFRCCCYLIHLVTFMQVLLAVRTNEAPQSTMYATKSRYIDTLSEATKLALSHLEESTHHHNADDICQPVHLNILIRHGIRKPGASDIKAVDNFLRRIFHTVADREKLMYLQEAADMFSLSDEKELSETGWQELRDLGVRFSARFHDLLHKAHADDLIFSVTSKSRTQDSCAAFMSSLSAVNISLPEPQVQDDLLRFFDNCEKYLQDVDNNNLALIEHHKFKRAHFPKVAEHILSHLGHIHGGFSMSQKEVKAAFVYAASELAVFGTGHWGQLFTEQDRLIMEYAADLKNYWKKSYGHKINYEQASELLKDVTTNMVDVASGKRSTVGVFRFGHAETLLPFTALLGLHQDNTPLTADAFSKMSNRQFKTSYICPFASNVAIVLYQCKKGSVKKDSSFYDSAGFKLTLPEKMDDFMVGLLHKEEPVKFPFCHFHLCSLQEFIEYYSDVLDTNWDLRCTGRVVDEL